ncbi:MAG: DUF779 domain-containing protein [Hyphomicrobium sp.]|nr:DUF779 domain-containing protein [Hyphomicrobium sp.]
MASSIQTCAITATPEARDALRRMVEQHGDIILHLAGANSGSHKPVCLPAGELRLGARDHLIGEVEGVAVYQMESRPGDECACGDYILDMADGLPVGFSLDAGNRRRFTLLRRRPQRDVALNPQDPGETNDNR